MTPGLIATLVALMIASWRWSWLAWAFIVVRVLPWSIGWLLGKNVAAPTQIAVEAFAVLVIPHFFGRLLFGRPKLPEQA